MAKYIRDGKILDNPWRRLNAGDCDAGVPTDGDIIVPLAIWRERRNELLARNGRTAVCLEPGEEPEEIAADLEHLPLVAISFPQFKDGRGFSYARELRTRYAFEGDVLAVGDVLRDQLFYMHRVGFNAFEPRADRDIHVALEGLRDFSVTYQGDVHDPRPIYHRREEVRKIA